MSRCHCSHPVPLNSACAPPFCVHNPLACYSFFHFLPIICSQIPFFSLVLFFCTFSTFQFPIPTLLCLYDNSFLFFSMILCCALKVQVYLLLMYIFFYRRALELLSFYTPSPSPSILTPLHTATPQFLPPWAPFLPVQH